jgi:ATP-dependent helicase/nuclease subunit A
VADVRVPPDQKARDRIAADLDSTLFVDAGAGSGKTRELVNRVLALIESGVELRTIAAITFTEKAGAELRDRIRRELEERSDARCQAALEQLDSAAIGTLHSFAQRTLSEHPIEAGLPPRIEVLDEVSSGVEFERRWATFRDQLLADPELERTILLLDYARVPEPALHALAVAFNDNWDLVEERVPTSAPEPPSVRSLLDPALDAVDAVCAERAGCTDANDRLVDVLCDVAEQMNEWRAVGDEYRLLELLTEFDGFKTGNVGSRKGWGCDPKEVRDRLRAAGEELRALRVQVAAACARRMGVAIREFTLAAADERRRAGRLEFHDLLVLARYLLTTSPSAPEVRAHLHERYQRLLLDEFQDTDPIQIELAEQIAGAASPGHLFMVGDAKQSIYRFRRADISMFLRARLEHGRDKDGLVALTANWRTVRPVIDCINRVFADLMSEPPDVDPLVPSQAEFLALDAMREAPPSGVPVAVLGRTPHPQRLKADELRELEAADVAAAVSRVMAEGWPVDDGHSGWRAANLGDITVLVPARTSLPFLEEALERAGVPFRAESSSLVYATRAVRDLLMVLRAVDDPTDSLCIVSALRTPLFGCGDDDLFRFKVERRGRWSYVADQPESVPADDPVCAGLSYLRSLHDQRYWVAPSELMDQIVRDRRAMELGFAEGRPRDVWRRLRFVIDQARAWSEATGGSLRQYLSWVEQQTVAGARVLEPVLPETDDDAVRIMTIHSAKGLEFPITIVSGLTTASHAVRAPAQVVFPPGGRIGYYFWGKVETPEFTEFKPIDEQMDFHERVRLLYVACTRARDHLILSLHRNARAGEPPKASSRTNAELLAKGLGDLLPALPEVGVSASDPEAPSVRPSLPSPPSPPMPFLEWERERLLALARAARPTAVAATALTDEGGPDTGEPGAGGVAGGVAARGSDLRLAPEATADPGLQKRPRDLDLPPWLKGRYGTAVGRAVHGVLQTIDLATGEGVDAAVAAQCEAEAIPDRVDQVRRLVGHALGSPLVREAATRSHWREVYACTPVDGRLLEGYVDLLYRADDGLVVIDYKTSATSDPAELDRRVGGYRLQGASYALAVAAATGEPVVRVTFVFLTPEGAVERDLPDLTPSVEHVRALVVAGTELVVG